MQKIWYEEPILVWNPLVIPHWPIPAAAEDRDGAGLSELSAVPQLQGNF